jgi:hypothetical protein
VYAKDKRLAFKLQPSSLATVTDHSVQLQQGYKLVREKFLIPTKLEKPFYMIKTEFCQIVTFQRAINAIKIKLKYVGGSQLKLNYTVVKSGFLENVRSSLEILGWESNQEIKTTFYCLKILFAKMGTV